ncbi:MAG: primosomal protein N' [Phycisphaerae bacterium]|nr:primosomal protein N' [Phycisphaerae bacterium]
MSESSLFSHDKPAPAYGTFVRVAVERGIDTLDGPDGLTYGIRGPEMPVFGERVIVPLGRGDATASGVVIAVGGLELVEGIDPARVKPLVRRTGAKVPRPLIELGEWMARYYVCPLGMVLSGLLPASVKTDTGRKTIELAERPPPPATPPRLRGHAKVLWEAVSAWPDSEFPMPLRVLAARGGVKSLAPARRLIEAGLLRTFQTTEVRAADLPGADPAAAPAVELTEEQRAAVEGIAATFGRFAPHLIRGVTGSGKTEVYLRLIDRVFAEGKTAIMLVPEIALTPQTCARFIARFGEARVALLHSGLTPAQRNREWRRACSGGASVVVGARSAVFAPLSPLGLIIVDEEHDSSYKQDRLPRYNARDVAVKRAHLEGCPVVLGSATPSLESWYNAAPPRSRYHLWTLPGRVGGGALPPVRIVDLTEERRLRWRKAPDRMQHLLGPTLEDAMERSLREGAQSILLLNRRGFASYISCRAPACQYVHRCVHCDVNLVLHRGREGPPGGYVRCHHCEAAQLLPERCPACGQPMNYFSGGTQRVEDELIRKFGHLGLEEGRTLLRVDSDTMRSGKDYLDALGRFAKGEVRVLVGTQMIAKGLDVPNVRLVGVIDADTALHIPDFRASERTFQLVSQVAGRAGRGHKPGVVIVQTHSPKALSILLAADHDYEGFAESELRTRLRAGLPPASRMARIVCRDLSEAKSRTAAKTLHDALREAAPRGVELRGPAPCPIARIADHYRHAVEVLAPTAAALATLLSTLRSRGLLKSDARTAVDVDPVSLM